MDKKTNQIKKPLVSVIIPTLNEGRRLEKCLQSVVSQTYKEIEILIVDDGSTDATLTIAKKFKARIIKNGAKNIEIAKSLGVKNALGELLLFFDADNQFVAPDWIQDCVTILGNHPSVVGVQSDSFYYTRSHNLVNRYCELMGINDPLAFHLGKRGQKMMKESGFPHVTTLTETQKYKIVKFSTANLPPIGSQGYCTRKSLIKKTTWQPYMFHMDSAWELVALGHTEFAYLKSPVLHDYVQSLSDLKRKLQRNVRLYLTQNNLRKYKYDLTSLKLAFALFTMLTLVYPFAIAVRGYLRFRDRAWFMHPVLCVLVIFWYTQVYLTNFQKRLSK